MATVTWTPVSGTDDFEFRISQGWPDGCKVLIARHKPTNTEEFLAATSHRADAIQMGAPSAYAALRYAFGSKFMREHGYEEREA